MFRSQSSLKLVDQMNHQVFRQLLLQFQELQRQKHLYSEFALKKGPLEVGDRTVRGEVVEIGPKRKWIKTKGSWGNGEEIKKWTDVENVKHSVDYERYHRVREIRECLK